MGTMAPIAKAASTTTTYRQRRAARANGWYAQIKNLLMGFFSSAGTGPRIRSVIRNGPTVIASKAAKNMENVLVHASGFKSPPSWSFRLKTVREATVRTDTAKE